jgi:hypothetical protein
MFHNIRDSLPSDNPSSPLITWDTVIPETPTERDNIKADRVKAMSPKRKSRFFPAYFL